MCQKTYTNKGLGSSGLLDSGGHTWVCARTIWQEGGSFLAHWILLASPPESFEPFLRDTERAGDSNPHGW